MSIEAAFARLQIRIERCARTDADLARKLAADLEVLRSLARAATTARALAILSADRDALEDLERACRRRVPPDDQIAAAVRQHGGVRAAARALHIGVATVSRAVARCSTGTLAPCVKSQTR